MSAGYSGTPLAKKLVIKEGQRVGVVDDPGHFAAIVAPLPSGARIVNNPRSPCETFVVFTPTERRFREVLPKVLNILPADASYLDQLAEEVVAPLRRHDRRHHSPGCTSAWRRRRQGVRGRRGLVRSPPHGQKRQPRNLEPIADGTQYSVRRAGSAASF